MSNDKRQRSLRKKIVISNLFLKFGQFSEVMFGIKSSNGYCFKKYRILLHVVSKRQYTLIPLECSTFDDVMFWVNCVMTCCLDGILFLYPKPVSYMDSVNRKQNKQNKHTRNLAFICSDIKVDFC